MIKKSITAFLLIFYIGIGFSDDLVRNETVPIVGLYLDSFTGLSVKGGVQYIYGAENRNTRSLAFIDLEAGINAQKLTVGAGIHFIEAGAVRYGLSYAQKDTEDYVGLEGLISMLGITLKVGAYHSDRTSEHDHLTLGIGVGW